MNLQHDEVVKKFDMAAVVLVSVVTLFEIIIGKRMFCKVSFVVATRLGIKLDLSLKKSGSEIPWYQILVTLTLICYLISVLVENKNVLLNTVWDIIHKVCKRPSKISQDPEQGEELQSMSRRAEFSESQSAGLERSVLSPTNSSPADPIEAVGVPRIIQITAYRSSALQGVPSVHKEDESQQEGLSSGLSSSEAKSDLSEGQESKQMVSPSSQEDTGVLQECVSKSEKSFSRLDTLSSVGAQQAPGSDLESATVVSPSHEKILQTEYQSNEIHSNENGKQPGELFPRLDTLSSVGAQLALGNDLEYTTVVYPSHMEIPSTEDQSNGIHSDENGEQPGELLPRLYTLSSAGAQLALGNYIESFTVVSPSHKEIPPTEDQSNGIHSDENGEQPGETFPRLYTLSSAGAQLVLGNDLESTTVVYPSHEEIPPTEDQSNGIHSDENGEQPGESSQEILWKASFLVVIFSFTLVFIINIVDIKNELAINLAERLNILIHYCLPFYWVILVDECFFVSKRLVRTWLAEYCSIYFD